MHVRHKLLTLAIVTFWPLSKVHAGMLDADGLAATNSAAFLPTNWVVEARKVLPPTLFITNLTFTDFTNLVSREAQRGNQDAEGLLGDALLITSRTFADATNAMVLIQNAANGGSAKAMTEMGLIDEEGRLVRRNYDQAFHWFTLAAAKNEPEGILELGGCYHYGLGITPNTEKAAECYLQSAELTNYVAMKSYGYFLCNGIGVKKDLDTAQYWLTRAAEEGNNRRAMYDLGYIYSRKFPDTNAMGTAFRWYTRSAHLGDPLACDELANFYFNGWGVVETNLASYRYWLFRAATLGVTDAQFRVGNMYQDGDGVPKDLATSLVWYRKAAAKNHPNAIYDLAVYYRSQKTNPAALDMAGNLMLQAAQLGNREAEFQCALTGLRQQDMDAFLQWINEAADSGWAKADYLLFQFNYYGVPATNGLPAFPRDKGKGIYWLRKAAQDGSIRSQALWGRMLVTGVNTDKNPIEAEKWLRNAATHGNAEAQNDLGFAIYDGDVGSTNLVEAAMWCELAGSQTNDLAVARNAQVNLTRVDLQLTAEQQIAADQQIKNLRILPDPQPNPMTNGWTSNPAYQQEDGRFGH